MFEGVYGRTSVEVNGIPVAEHAYGYTEFAVDISETVCEGENIIKVTVDNHLEPNSRWYSGSGIYRSVHLMIKDCCHIRSVYVTTVSICPAVIDVKVEPEEATVEILDGDRLIAEGYPGQIEIPDARLWSAETPYLYTCKVRTDQDEKNIQFGIRTLEWSAKEGFLVNGKETLLRGGCIHHDNGILGACAYADAEERRVKILKKAGYNAIRSSHNPCSRAFLDACDRMGMYVMDEAFDGWYTPKNYHDYSRDFEENFRKDLESMVRRDRNHPSVIMYSIGNEVTETAEERGIQLAGEMTKLIHSLDGTRPVTCGINPMLNLLSANGQGVYKDIGEYRPEPLPEIEKVKKPKKTGSALFNAIMQKTNGLTEMMAGSKAADKVIRDVAAKLDILGLNYAGSRYDKDVKNYPERLMVGSETLVSALPYNWKRVKMHKAVIGDFVWTAWDYLGEAGIGDWTYFSDEGMLMAAGCGTIDLIGTPGAENYFQQIVWNLRKEPYIGVRPITHCKEMPRKSRWRFTDAIASWSWHGYEGCKAEVEVYADAYQVELYHNHQRIGRKRINDYRVCFRTKYMPGILMAIALDETGKEVSRKMLKTAGETTKLSIKTDREMLQANGHDLCHIEIALTDENGIVKPAKDVRVTVEIEGGNAILMGVGSAKCKTNERLNGNSHMTHYGRALAIVKAGYQCGEARIRIGTEEYGEVEKVIKLVSST